MNKQEQQKAVWSAMEAGEIEKYESEALLDYKKLASYFVPRLKRISKERQAEIARENGKKGGRPKTVHK